MKKKTPSIGGTLNWMMCAMKFMTERETRMIHTTNIECGKVKFQEKTKLHLSSVFIITWLMVTRNWKETFQKIYMILSLNFLLRNLSRITIVNVKPKLEI